ncbi:hypothetical protein [Acidovorax sp. ST3]|uniref:hypothetical protein n=1 Tax=Acidovorax sp. ST3 TaxID=2219062 RepID=UPI00137B2E45|nr:hypothetical protein [Acidovorax sp. ST3]
MKRPVLIGGGLAILVLVVVFFAGWVAGGRDGSVAARSALPATTVVPARSEPQGSAGNVQSSTSAQPSSIAPQIGGTQTPATVTAITSDERRKRLAQVRSDISALMANGALGSPEKALALINELEQLSQGSADPRYFQTLRNMLESTAKVQGLSAELQKISGSSKPEDIARRQEILSQLQQLSTRISAEAADLQSGARRAANAGKS